MGGQTWVGRGLMVWLVPCSGLGSVAEAPWDVKGGAFTSLLRWSLTMAVGAMWGCEILDVGAVALEGGLRGRLFVEHRGSCGCPLGYVYGEGRSSRGSRRS